MNDLIKEMFEKSGLTRKEFSGKIGMKSGNFSNSITENPRHIYSLKKTIEIASIMGYTIDIKLSETEETQRSEPKKMFDCGCTVDNKKFYKDKKCNNKVHEQAENIINSAFEMLK